MSHGTKKKEIKAHGKSRVTLIQGVILKLPHGIVLVHICVHTSMYVDEFCTCDWHEKGDDNGGDGWVKKRGSFVLKKLREMKNDNFWCENSIFPSGWF